MRRHLEKVRAALRAYRAEFGRLHKLHHDKALHRLGFGVAEALQSLDKTLAYFSEERSHPLSYVQRERGVNVKNPDPMSMAI